MTIDSNINKDFGCFDIEQKDIRLQAIEDKLEVYECYLVNLATRQNPSIGRAKERVPRVALLIRRDLLVVAIERNWDKIDKRLRRAKTDDQYRAILETILDSRKDLADRLQFDGLANLFQKHRLQFRPVTRILNAFGRRDAIALKLFNRLPSRVIANAIAGAPEYACSTSLRFTIDHPSPVPICHRLKLHYQK